jgi:general secretion pathway protein G
VTFATKRDATSVIGSRDLFRILFDPPFRSWTGRWTPIDPRGISNVLYQRRSEEDQTNIIEQGFTLVELLIVIVILGILAGIVVFAVGNLTSDAKTSACSTEKSMVNTALEAYKAKKGAYPTGADASDRMTELATVAGFKTNPTSYEITDNNGTVAPIANNPNGCT